MVIVRFDFNLFMIKLIYNFNCPSRYPILD